LQLLDSAGLGLIPDARQLGNDRCEASELMQPLPQHVVQQSREFCGIVFPPINCVTEVIEGSCDDAL